MAKSKINKKKTLDDNMGTVSVSEDEGRKSRVRRGDGRKNRMRKYKKADDCKDIGKRASGAKASRNLNSLTSGEILGFNNNDLIIHLEKACDKERKIKIEIIRYLREVERRDLHLQLGFSSLFDFAMNHLKYSEGEALRRMNAMWLIDSVPKAEGMLESGSLSLTVAARVYRFADKNKLDADELVQKVEGLSSRKAEKVLLGICPEEARKERMRVISSTLKELLLPIDEELGEYIEQLMALFSHINPDQSYQKLFKILCKKVLKEFEPKSRPRTEAKSEARAKSKSKVMSGRNAAGQSCRLQTQNNFQRSDLRNMNFEK
jgi:hypothetical protein